MTLASGLITRVRSLILESVANQRTDAEILQWLQDAQIDYFTKVGILAFPNLTTTASATGGSYTLPSDFVRLTDVQLNHTISGTTTAVDTCYLVQPDDQYLLRYSIAALGAWAQVQGGRLAMGPNAITATISYVKEPTALTATTTTFSLATRHEEPVVLRAAALACLKINDTDFEKFMSLYAARVTDEINAYKGVIKATV